MHTWRQLSRVSMSQSAARVTAQRRRRGSFIPVRSRGTPVPKEARKPLAYRLVALGKVFLEELKILPQAASPFHPQSPGSQKGISAQHCLP